MIRNADTADLFGSETRSAVYRPRRALHFEPERIMIAKGSMDDPESVRLVEGICALYPSVPVEKRFDLPHNRIEMVTADLLGQHYQGKKTLVFGVHGSALHYSEEGGNACPNYWHFSPYGFCPYDCQYCYLAGTPGVKYSPVVKIFVNLRDVLAQVEEVASGFSAPTALYLGKLQDGLALDLLTGYSRVLVPFFARQPYARLILLTKSASVENLLGLDHRGHTILSWSLNPPEISQVFERNVPSPADRLTAMRRCAAAGYLVRAVLMPIIPVTDWQDLYTRFVEELLRSVPLQRITLGQICSYAGALTLMEAKLSQENPISRRLDRQRSADGRVRFPWTLRVQIYRYLIDCIRRIQPALDIGLCLEEPRTFDALDLLGAVGRCNCVV
jgi:spore photoproduct lyase